MSAPGRGTQHFVHKAYAFSTFSFYSPQLRSRIPTFPVSLALVSLNVTPLIYILQNCLPNVITWCMLIKKTSLAKICTKNLEFQPQLDCRVLYIKCMDEAWIRYNHSSRAELQEYLLNIRGFQISIELRRSYISARNLHILHRTLVYI